MSSSECILIIYRGKLYWYCYRSLGVNNGTDFFISMSNKLSTRTPRIQLHLWDCTTHFSGSQGVQAPIVTCPSEMDGIPKMSLPVFGLASYKFKASMWTPNGGFDCQLAGDLLQAAHDCVRELRVNHPDFLFFCRWCRELGSLWFPSLTLFSDAGLKWNLEFLPKFDRKKKRKKKVILFPFWFPALVMEADRLWTSISTKAPLRWCIC